jgi:hypothetical protein
MKKYSALLFACVTLTLGPLASAGTLGISLGRLIVGHGAGDGNQAIVASMVGNDLRISGADFDLVTPGCTSLGSATFDCPISGFNELVILGGDGDDAITLSAIAQPNL